MKKIFLFIAFIWITGSSIAQINEIGIMVGGSNYIGDVGSEYYINPNNFMGSLIYKWNKNPRIAYRSTFTYTQISANDKKATNPERLNRGLRFTNSVKELTLGLEFNFFEYNLDDYKYTQTPYILIELAAYRYSYDTQNTVVNSEGSNNPVYRKKTSIALPFGIGYKTKLFQDFAIAFEVRARYTFNDNLDYYNERNEGIVDLQKKITPSNDWYMLTGISLVYTFGRPACYAPTY